MKEAFDKLQIQKDKLDHDYKKHFRVQSCNRRRLASHGRLSMKALTTNYVISRIGWSKLRNIHGN
jgi:hypothetical protein